MRPAVRKTGLAALSHLKSAGAMCSAAGNASKISRLTLPMFTHIYPYLYADIFVIGSTVFNLIFMDPYIVV
jgi:hypothetical protein